METTLVNNMFQLTATATVVPFNNVFQDLSVWPLLPIPPLKLTKLVRKSSVSKLVKISPSTTLQPLLVTLTPITKDGTTQCVKVQVST